MTDPNNTDLGRLEQLIRGRHPCITITTVEEDYAICLIREAILATPHVLNIWSINGGIRDGLIHDHPPAPETEHPAAALFYLLKQPGPSISVFLDLQSHLRDERTHRLLRDAIGRCKKIGGQIILLDHSDGMPTIIEAMSARFDIALPNEAEIDLIVRAVIRRVNEQQKIQADIGRRAFQTILRNLRGLSRSQIEQVVTESILDDSRFDADDLGTILTRKRQMLRSRGLLEFIETPEDLASVGGLKRLKKWLQNREDVFSEEAAKFGLTPPRGILMLGVQGAGKSYCAKAIATAWKRPLLRMDVGALYDKYVGESERHLRDAFLQAEAMAPIILWIDEIEKAFASAAARNVDGGLSQRMFGALLTWMQEHRSHVFLIATANDLEALPPELLRKGRFDEIFFVDLPVAETREEIVAIHLRKRGRDPSCFDVKRIALAAEGYTGAEIEQGIISALHVAYASKTQLDTDGVVAALADSPPISVVQAERIAALREWSVRRCLPAD